MITHVLEMLKVVKDPIEYLEDLEIPYSVRNLQPFDPLGISTLYVILIEYKNTKYTVGYRMIDGEWFYVQ